MSNKSFLALLACLNMATVATAMDKYAMASSLFANKDNNEHESKKKETADEVITKSIFDLSPEESASLQEISNDVAGMDGDGDIDVLRELLTDETIPETKELPSQIQQQPSSKSFNNINLIPTGLTNPFATNNSTSESIPPRYPQEFALEQYLLNNKTNLSSSTHQQSIPSAPKKDFIKRATKKHKKPTEKKNKKGNITRHPKKPKAENESNAVRLIFVNEMDRQRKRKNGDRTSSTNNNQPIQLAQIPNSDPAIDNGQIAIINGARSLTDKAKRSLENAVHKNEQSYQLFISDDELDRLCETIHLTKRVDRNAANSYLRSLQVRITPPTLANELERKKQRKKHKKGHDTKPI